MDAIVKISDTDLSGVYVVESQIRGDTRGSFSRLFCNKELSSVIGSRTIVQINQSKTAEKGTVRGLHYQNSPFAEMKLIRCLKGAVWDVALDLREGSPTFLKWHAQELTQENNLMMVIPEGVAHGFQTIKNDSELLYLHTEYYEPEHEAGVRHNDPMIAIEWPLNIKGMSDRDLSFPLLDNEFKGLKFNGLKGNKH